MTETDSPYFKVISPSDVGNKVAPGMDKVFMLQFTADQKKVKIKMFCRTECIKKFYVLFTTRAAVLFQHIATNSSESCISNTTWT